MRRSLPVLLVLALFGCATGSTNDRCEGLACGPRDGSTPDATTDAGDDPRDAATSDAALDASTDAATPVDAGADSGGPVDGGGACGGAPCDLWMLPHGATRWSALSRGTTGFAPTTPVRAAFDVESLGQAWVLTDGTYHVMRVSDRAWIAAGTRGSLFPEASGAALRSALSLPFPHGGGFELVFLSSATAAYQYKIHWADGRIEFTGVTTEFDDQWRTPNAPPRDRIRFDWFDDRNDRGWASVDPRTLCDTTATTLGTYGVYATDTHTHLQDGLACFAFFRRDPLPAFTPLSFAGAPTPSVVGAAFQHDGAIYLFAE